MREFPIVDPARIPDDPRTLARLDYRQDGREKQYFVLLDEAHALLMTRRLYRNPETGTEKWLVNQVELPKRGLEWIVDTIEQKFFKTSAEGGLAKGSLHHRETLDGEELALHRGVALGGPGYAGYDLRTLSRRDEETGLARNFPMTDDLLFEQGFFELLRSVAERVRSGEL